MSFKESFTKDEPKSAILDYDDGAFYYFAATVLIVALVPWTLIHIKRRLAGSQSRTLASKMKLPSGAVLRRCACRACVERRPNANKTQGLRDRFLGTRSDVVKTLMIAFGWALVLLICKTRLSVLESMSVFDPFDILNIAAGAIDSQIKKAYRTMSLKFHPDKNKNDPSSAAKFIMVSKAFQALTDETAKKNYQKYGNPDGPGMMKVGIGLPKWLVSDNSQVFVLAVFCLFLLVVIPAVFILYYQKISAYAPNGLKHETVNFLSAYISERTLPQHVHQFVAATAETRAIGMRPSDAADLAKLAEGVTLPSADLKNFRNPTIQKNILLLSAHLQRKTHLLTPPLREDLKKIMKLAIPITRVMIDISFINNWIPAIQAVLSFRKSLYQALEIKNVPYFIMQLPHTDENRAIAVGKAVQKLQLKGLRELVNAAFIRKTEALKGYSEEELRDVSAVYDQIPEVALEARVSVDDEEEICVGDIAMCQVKMTRTHLKEGEAQGPIHAPFYPEERFEEWFFFISDAVTHQLYGCKSSRSLERVVEVDVQFPVIQAGDRKLLIVALCDSYFGVDHSIQHTFRAATEQQVKRRTYVHPEDLALDNQPSFYQQVMGKIGEDSVSSDASDDETESPKK